MGDSNVTEKKKKRAPQNFVNNADLLEEIQISQAEQARNPDKLPSECMTPKLIEMIFMMVTRYADRYNWRGYSYVDEMKDEAIANLMRTALKFNPEKSNNPFAYYTQIATRCFLTYMDKEKVQQRIRDELIEMNSSGDFKPSFARQAEGEQNQLGIDLDGTKRVKSDPLRMARARKLSNERHK